MELYLCSMFCRPAHNKWSWGLRLIRPALAFSLFFSMAMQMFRGDFIILDYYTHQQAFSEACINKGKPQMHCNGKCQMYKKMRQNHQQEQDHPELANSVKIVLYCMVDALHFSWPSMPGSAQEKFPRIEVALVHHDPLSVFHPPARIPV
ncbi:MAG TPA: hypothetical protein VFL76_01405 [Edaphocola sp.]|nr:hypothetical protein [Edaphocola sp.]